MAGCILVFQICLRLVVRLLPGDPNGFVLPVLAASSVLVMVQHGVLSHCICVCALHAGLVPTEEQHPSTMICVSVESSL